jgi:Zn-dependent protease with chaperone function
MILLFTAASFLAALLLSAGLNWLALIPWRRSAGAHWTERARRLYPTRISAALNPWLIAANVGMAMHMLAGGAVLVYLPSALAAWLGAAASNYFVDRLIWPCVSFENWAGQFALYALFFQTSLLLLAISIVVMPSFFCWQTWVIAGVLLTIQLALLLGLSLKILRWTNLVQPAPATLRALALREAERAGAKLRQVWINRCPAAQAFALLPMKDMLFSERLVQILTEDELASVCAHEAAHLTESEWVLAGRLTSVAGLGLVILTVPVINRFGLVGLVPLLVATITLLYLPIRLARRMERRADATAVQQTTDPAVYARALLPAVMPKRSARTHPDLYDRILAAGVTPSYQRPGRPRKMSWTSFFFALPIAAQIVTTNSLPEIKRFIDFVIDSGRPPVVLDRTTSDNGSHTSIGE